ncbi:hypothetical protein D9M71_629040 [compost metagenome]
MQRREGGLHGGDRRLDTCKGLCKGRGRLAFERADGRQRKYVVDQDVEPSEFRDYVFHSSPRRLVQWRGEGQGMATVAANGPRGFLGHGRIRI